MKDFHVTIPGLDQHNVEARSYSDVTSKILCHPERFDLNNATLDGIVLITNRETKKVYYFRLRHNGQFFLDRVADTVGIRDSNNFTV
jgi:hypothetical protein